MNRYRQDSHWLSLLAWAILCTAAAGVLFIQGHKILKRELELAEIAGGVTLLIFGPVAFVLYRIRARLLWVGFDSDRGLLLSGKHLIPWQAIEKVERRRPRLRKKSGPAEPWKVDWGSDGSSEGAGRGCLRFIDFGGGSGGGVLVGILVVVIALLVFLAAAVLIWLIVFVFIPLVIIPVLEVFAPFGDRITITAGGRKLVLRDLRDADRFLMAVSRKVRVLER